MNPGGNLVRVGLLVAAAGVLVVAARAVGDRHKVAQLTTRQIEDTVSALDPATRAALVARLTADAAEHVKGRVGG